MRLLAHLLMKLFVLIVQFSVSYLFEMTITADDIKKLASFMDDLTKANYLGFTSEGAQLRTALFNVYQGYRHG